MPDVYDKVSRERKPDWLKTALQGGEEFSSVAQLVRKNALATICSSGLCPNRAECWSHRRATLMIMGDICTRSCRFCATKTGKPLPLDRDEPERVARSIHAMGLKHAVVTSVTRDDLPDGGAAHWAATVNAIRQHNPGTTIEVLIPDMDARKELLDIILSSSPDIVGHNVETVRRLTPTVRSRAKYGTSLEVLKMIASAGFRAKSGIMLGMGETRDEILETLDDLRAAGCSIVTLGQYLRPSVKHIPIAEYITPGEFDRLGGEARARGFDYVASGPLVRSSYMADEALKAINK